MKEKVNNVVNFTQSSGKHLSFSEKQTVEITTPKGFGFGGSNVMRRKKNR